MWYYCIMGDFAPYTKKTYTKTSSQSETDLILKLYRKQMSLYNKGAGPKPDINALISKSRVKDFGFDWSRYLQSPEDKTFKGLKTCRSIEFPKNLEVQFVRNEESRPGFYLVKFTTGVKFGISKSIKKRLLDYQKPWCHTILDNVFFYTSYSIARDIETVLIREQFTYCSSGTKEFIVSSPIEEIIMSVKSLVKIHAVR